MNDETCTPSCSFCGDKVFKIIVEDDNSLGMECSCSYFAIANDYTGNDHAELKHEVISLEFENES